MAILRDQITIGNHLILVLDSDPSTGSGYNAPIGSLAMVEGSAGLWQKNGAGSTNWLATSVNVEDIEDIVGNLLTDSAEIDFIYNDGANTLTANLQNTTVTPGSYGSASSVGTFTVDAKGRLTAASSTAINITSSQVSDFVEAAQDAVGTALVDSSTIDFTYNDSANQITAAVIPSGINHGALSGLSSDDHAQYALLAGRAGGQVLNGGSAASNNLTLSSTSNATKGRIILGSNSAFDEANTRLGIGVNTPSSIFHLREGSLDFNVFLNSTTTTNNTPTPLLTISAAANGAYLIKAFITAHRTNGSNEVASFERTFMIRNNGGTVSVITFQSDYTARSPSTFTVNVDTLVSSTNVDIRALGLSGNDITWKIVAQRLE
ncbi:MAG: hypothetical protein RML94_14140 [Bacteroidia bacterium]|nr:hypothetical protein [Bacteroidia bacterium]